jgi:DNA-binding transcriptional ArsR family regulator
VIRIELDEPTLNRTRISISPLDELICSLYLLDRNPDAAPWPYDGWAISALEVLRSDPVMEPLALYRRLRSAFPDFLLPIPRSACATIEEQLDALRATPVTVVRTQLAKHYPGAVPAYLGPFDDDPVRALGRLADALEAYWDRAMAPYWPAMSAALDEEVLLRARALAADGPDALLSHLHSRIRWEPPTLTLEKPLVMSFRALDQRLLLVPLIFSRGALMCSTDDPDIIKVTYQARGAAVLADRPAYAEVASPDRLGLLIGRSRAAVLRALGTPATTAGLATALGLAQSTVSEHLAALHDAGVVHRRRVGRRVLYGLEPAGLALVNLLDPEQFAGASA